MILQSLNSEMKMFLHISKLDLLVFNEKEGGDVI